MSVLLELLSSDDNMARRAASESLAFMGLKVGDGYAVYLVQVRHFAFVGVCRSVMCVYFVLAACFGYVALAPRVGWGVAFVFSRC